MTDLRALITQLCDELDHNRRCLLDDRRLTHPLSDKARAALVETDGPAVSGDREPASVAKQYSGELSPAARSVFESFNSKFEWVEDGVPGPQFSAIAAALRAAANEVAPEKTIEDIDYVAQSYVDGYRDALNEIRSIANELRATHD